MTYHVLPVWVDQSGAETGPISLPPAKSEADVPRLIKQGFSMARRARGINVRALVVCDLTWRTVHTVKPKRNAS